MQSSLASVSCFFGVFCCRTAEWEVEKWRECCMRPIEKLTGMESSPGNFRLRATFRL